VSDAIHWEQSFHDAQLKRLAAQDSLETPLSIHPEKTGNVSWRRFATRDCRHPLVAVLNWNISGFL
jgi:hypothetical protein